MSRATRASSKDENPIKITCNIKKRTRSTACYDIIKRKNNETKHRLCCDDCKKLLDDPMSVRKCKRKSKFRQQWSERRTNHSNISWVHVHDEWCDFLGTLSSMQFVEVSFCKKRALEE